MQEKLDFQEFDGVEQFGVGTSYTNVMELMHVMGQDTPAAIGWPDEATFRLRVRLDLEEQWEKLIKGYFMADMEQIIDGACDVDVVGTGSMIAFGVNMDTCNTEVHLSNMSKLDTDGKPIKDAGGKFLKGPNYFSPRWAAMFGEALNTKPPYDTQSIVRDLLADVMLKYMDSHPEAFGLTIIKD